MVVVEHRHLQERQAGDHHSLEWKVEGNMTLPSYIYVNIYYDEASRSYSTLSFLDLDSALKECEWCPIFERMLLIDCNTVGKPTVREADIKSCTERPLDALDRKFE